MSVVLVSGHELQPGSNTSNKEHKKVGRSGTSLALIRCKYKNQEEVPLERERLPVMSSRKDKEKASWQDAQEVENCPGKDRRKNFFLDTSKKKNKKTKTSIYFIPFMCVLIMEGGRNQTHTGGSNTSSTALPYCDTKKGNMEGNNTYCGRE